MPKLIDVAAAPTHHPGIRLLKRCAKPMERLLAIDRINDAYERFHRKVVAEDVGESVFATALDELHIRMVVQRGHPEHIPDKGPLVIVANHPFGGVEGLILGALLLRVRPDVMLLGNYLLQEIIGIRDYILPVNPFGNKRDTAKNARGLRHCLRWLKKQGSLIAFPAGEVASWHPRRGGVADPVWHPQIATLIRLSRATVVPVYFPGRNSVLFMMLGLLHPRLRTALLPRELINKAGKNIAVHIGAALPWQRLQRFPDDTALIRFLRLRTELLQIDAPPRKHTRPSSTGENHVRHLEPVSAPVPAPQMLTEIGRLPGDQCLLKNGPFSVWLAESRQIPSVLEEIGRLREITFREAQEGTGRSSDLDRFDEHYRHLFLWHHEKAEVVGGYRLGFVDTIVREHGLEGLYTHSLFRFGPDLLRQLPPAIEFGRSFIRPEYQKKYNSLLLIWRGIGRLIAGFPRYQILFGPVSISRDYETVSRNLLVHFLKRHKFNDDLSRHVSPRQPYRAEEMKLGTDNELLSSLSDIENVSLLISEIEKDGKGVPVLLKHYLKLNGKLLSFNVDTAFSDVVDGLLMVDLRETDPKLLKRFLGSPSRLSGQTIPNSGIRDPGVVVPVP